MVSNAAIKHIKNIFIVWLEIKKTIYRLFNNNEKILFGGHIS
jgi:hypothetical protein